MFGLDVGSMRERELEVMQIVGNLKEKILKVEKKLADMRVSRLFRRGVELSQVQITVVQSLRTGFMC